MQANLGAKNHAAVMPGEMMEGERKGSGRKRRWTDRKCELRRDETRKGQVTGRKGRIV